MQDGTRCSLVEAAAHEVSRDPDRGSNTKQAEEEVGCRRRIVAIDEVRADHVELAVLHEPRRPLEVAKELPRKTVPSLVERPSVGHARWNPSAVAVVEGDQFYLVEDIGATNGTFLNASRVQTGVPVEISAGDTLRFGLVELSLIAD